MVLMSCVWIAAVVLAASGADPPPNVVVDYTRVSEFYANTSNCSSPIYFEARSSNYVGCHIAPNFTLPNNTIVYNISVATVCQNSTGDYSVNQYLCQNLNCTDCILTGPSNECTLFEPVNSVYETWTCAPSLPPPPSGTVHMTLYESDDCNLDSQTGWIAFPDGACFPQDDEYLRVVWSPGAVFSMYSGCNSSTCTYCTSYRVVTGGPTNCIDGEFTLDYDGTVPTTATGTTTTTTTTGSIIDQHLVIENPFLWSTVGVIVLFVIALAGIVYIRINARKGAYATVP